MKNSRAFGRLIQSVSLEHGLNCRLIASVVWVESKGNPWAFRHEPGFYTKYIKDKKLSDFIPDPSLCSLQTEKQARSTSWGLMQVMGQVAREQGFKGLLTELLVPEVNLTLGASILAQHLKAKGALDLALLRWNGGGDSSYPTRVLQAMDSADIERILMIA